MAKLLPCFESNNLCGSALDGTSGWLELTNQPFVRRAYVPQLDCVDPGVIKILWIKSMDPLRCVTPLGGECPSTTREFLLRVIVGW
ncbi:hypothetical protein JTE90_014651 [Oedothorax gibbosus]|uniref:Uncharacterized protein n=1 Tax=Oedothorax gibbosus TaxID=931172 RepID=A0AAV6VA97_9ARAC|nr:hypothetical protein JTE90_014651 [Oedothorax gibbosus]